MSELFNPPFIIAILIALTVHEAAHALVAYLLGDSTAKHEGRLTLNPVAHLDFLGTVLFFLVRFGWGKPVPVDPRNFRHPKRDSALTALAGPFSNFLVALLCVFLLVVVAPQIIQVDSMGGLAATGTQLRLQTFFLEILDISISLNLGLMAFNLLPIAPLDGSKILEAFIPLKYDDQYYEIMQKGPFILLGLLLAERALNLPLLATWINWIATGALSIITMVLRV